MLFLIVSNVVPSVSMLFLLFPMLFLLFLLFLLLLILLLLFLVLLLLFLLFLLSFVFIVSNTVSVSNVFFSIISLPVLDMSDTVSIVSNVLFYCFSPCVRSDAVSCDAFECLTCVSGGSGAFAGPEEMPVVL